MSRFNRACRQVRSFADRQVVITVAIFLLTVPAATRVHGADAPRYPFLATTDDGSRAVLFPDGTWQYLGEANFEQPENILKAIEVRTWTKDERLRDYWIQEAEEKVLRNPDDYELLLQLGNTYFDLGKRPQSIRAYLAALEIDGSDANVWTDLGTMFRELRLFNEAYTAYSKAVEINPSFAMPHLHLGLLHSYNVNDYARGITEFETFLSLEQSGNRADIVRAQMKTLQSIQPLLAPYKREDLRYFIAASGSMTPTYGIGDHVIIDMNYFKTHEIKRFDLVTVSNPTPPIGNIEVGGDLVKRVIALGGETIALTDGKVYVNGKDLEESFPTIAAKENFGPFSVPPGEYFLLGDNRGASYDSRFWSTKTVKSEGIGGKVVATIPFDRKLIPRR